VKNAGFGNLLCSEMVFSVRSHSFSLIPSDLLCRHWHLILVPLTSYSLVSNMLN